MKTLFAFLLFTSFTLFTNNQLYSQDISFEEVKQICKENIPLEDRVRISVVRFTSRMRGAGQNQLGSELATMLTNSLYEVNCFRVLESAQKVKDFDTEFDLGTSGYTNGSGAEKGNFMGAQAIITGEITEYSEGAKDVSAFGLSIGKKTAHVGFVIKVLDVNTRDVLFTKSINMEGKSNGFNGLKAFGLKVAGSENRSKALNNALEKAIIKATEVLAKSKDSWSVKGDGAQADARGKKMIQLTIEINGIDFGNNMSMKSKLKSYNEIEDVTSEFKGSRATYRVASTIDSETIATKIYESFGEKYTIEEVSQDFIKLKKL